MRDLAQRPVTTCGRWVVWAVMPSLLAVVPAHASVAHGRAAASVSFEQLLWLGFVVTLIAAAIFAGAWWSASADAHKGRDDVEAWEALKKTLLEGLIILRPKLGPSGKPVDFVYEQVNPEAEALLGADHSELVGIGALERFPHMRASGDWQRFLDAWNSGSVLSWETDYDADRLKGCFRCRLVRSRERLVLSLQNINRQRHVEAQLADSEERFRALFQESPVAMTLFDPYDTEVVGRIVDCNEATARLHGFKRTELVGQSANLLQVVPGTREQLLDRLQTVQAWITPPRQVTARRKDGSLVQLLMSVRRLRLDGRELILATNIGVEAEHQTIEARREVEAVLAVVFNTAPFMMGVVEFLGDDMRLVLVNAPYARLFHKEPAEMAGRLASSLSSDPELFAVQVEHYRTCVEQQLPVEYELAARGRLFRVDVGPVANVGDGPPRVCFIIEDITERRRAADEVQRSRRLRGIGEMAGGMAREVNELLTPATLQLDLLLSQRTVSAEARAELQSVRQALQRTVDLNRRVLSFGRHREPCREENLLADVVRATLDLAGPSFDKRIDVQARLDVDLPALLIDRDELMQVLLNLLHNARDALLEKLAATPDAVAWLPELTLELEALSDGSQRLSVRDNGPGVAEELKPRLFEPFFTTKAATGHAGLGLATVWHVVHNFGGKVEWESSPDKGTSFSVVFPALLAVPRLRL